MSVMSSDRLEMTLYFLRNRIEQIRQFRAKANEKIAIRRFGDTLKLKVATRRDDKSLDAEIKDTLRSFPKAKRENLAKLFKVSLATITRRLKVLQLAGEIRRVGSRKTGHWEVLQAL